MDTLLTSLADYLIRQSGQIALWAAIITCGCLLLRKVSAHWRYWLWLPVIAKCLIPPVLTIPLVLLPPKPKPEPMVNLPYTVPSNEITPNIISSLPAIDYNALEPEYTPPLSAMPLEETVPYTPTLGEKFNSLTLKQKLAVVWLVGVVIYLVITGGKAIRLRYWLSKNRRPLTEALQQEYEKLLSRCHIKKGPGIWLVSGISQPFVWGLMRGSIYVPDTYIESYTKTHRGEVIMHELMHVMRFDTLVNILQIMTQALYFFHPLVWFANTNIRREREKCCDEMVLARAKSSPQQYSSALLENCKTASNSSKPTPSLAIAGPARNIEERIKAIMKPDKIFYSRPTGMTILTVLTLAVFMVPTALVLTTDSDVLNALETSILTDEDPVVSKEGLRENEAGEEFDTVALSPQSLSETPPGTIDENSIGMKLVWIPAGEFTMGSPLSEIHPSEYLRAIGGMMRGSLLMKIEPYRDESPQHQVIITQGFWMGIYEVTQGQWKRVMGNNPSLFQRENLPVEQGFRDDAVDLQNKLSPSLLRGDNLPVERVSWNDAVEFCLKLSQKEGMEYRLPTEAEWEYACRAGTTTLYSFGDDYSSLGLYAWYGANRSRQTIEVGQMKPNAFGLYDMYGNVWEWCYDLHGSYPFGSVTDPTGPVSGNMRVTRGGAWDQSPLECRSAERHRILPDTRYSYYGFRVVCTVPLVTGRSKFAFERAREVNTIGVYKEFIAEYPESRYAAQECKRRSKSAAPVGAKVQRLGR